MTLSTTQKNLVTATVPVLQQHGETITRVFYHNMFAAHPELYNLFNPANQRDGGQARSLAAAVLAYAENIDRTEPLGPMLRRINSKHASLDVQPDQYSVVGNFLLGAISEVLGSAATPDILDAWGAAYTHLAGLMIGAETTLYKENASLKSEWPGFKPFRVERKVPESEFLTSFYLTPKNGSRLPPFQPGQYLSLKVHPTGFAYDQIRQYSISCESNGHHYRISVQRELAPANDEHAPAGMVSNFLHNTIMQGDELTVHMPSGDFTLCESDRPVVLLSGGSGITAVLSMLQQLVSRSGANRKVLFMHMARSRGHHAFNHEVRAMIHRRPEMRAITLYEKAGPDDVPGQHHDAIGRISAEVLQRYLPERDADFYYCGPVGFMDATEVILDKLNIAKERRHSEAFGPDRSFDVPASACQIYPVQG